MQAITAKKALIFVITVFFMSFMVGCSGMERRPAYRSGYLYYPTELVNADRALDEARLAGKDRECSAEFNAAKEMVDKAYEVYMACHTKEAIAMAQAAIVKIKALCPAIPVTAAAPVPEAERQVIAYEDIHFDFNQSTLTPEAQTILKRNVQVLKDNPNTKVRIAGYASASGTEEYNQRLSETRAKVVQEFLISEGITQDRVFIIGYGETRPAMQETVSQDIYSKEAKANMRVLFEIVEQ
ncbi:MAG: hypothetical protein A2031_09685 [Deltaproteobacteria bacterium RBG_19FT_COMBO_43_11]|nr:MAG: hypothetical protein A2031_09685 [Deltaproteobacteria bacterium RBG_19FT_COMBO_43_11]